MKLREPREHDALFESVADALIKVVEPDVGVGREEPDQRPPPAIRIRLSEASFILVFPSQNDVKALNRLVVGQE